MEHTHPNMGMHASYAISCRPAHFRSPTQTSAQHKTNLSILYTKVSLSYFSEQVTRLSKGRHKTTFKIKSHVLVQRQSQTLPCHIGSFNLHRCQLLLLLVIEGPMTHLKKIKFFLGIAYTYSMILFLWSKDKGLVSLRG